MGLGGIDVGCVDGVFVCTSFGHVSIADSIAAQRALDQLAEEHPDVDCTLYDASKLDSFESGLPTQWVAWAKGRKRKSRRIALAVRQPLAIAVARMLRYLIPSIRIGLFADRNAAMSYLRCANAVGSDRSR